ncbi:tyrosine-type recombinase/integrase [Bradyrhizobium diazoefficiens]|nr:site-specific integrase [Bradyrhizobium diazoefficiens]MBR0703138.1 tyrosine-type recombinase/integrase [Bradyrhizobium diazoefficiens]MBR0771894.1 tyrosine-type recombinase/integrase [Bradyrhizobium diazoefficiens]
MTKQLTDAAIKKLKAGKKRIEVRVASGLSLLIHPSGKKSFIMRFRRPDGSPAKLTLGEFDPRAPELEGAPQIGMRLTLASAHWLAADVSRQRAIPGRDVIAELAAAKKRRQIDLDAKALTFPLAVRQFIDEHARKQNRGWRDVARVLGLAHEKQKDELSIINGSLCARWGDRPVGEITDHDIFAAIDEARRKGIPGLKRRGKGVSDPRGRHLGRALGKLFGWLFQNRRISVNPCAGVHVPPPPARRQRILSDVEVRALWKATEKLGYPFGPLVRGLLYVGARRDEVAGLNYPELSEDGERWVIAAERTKNKLPHLVPLAPQVRELIREASKFAKNSGNAGLVFTTTGKSAVSGFSKIKRRIDELMRKELGEAFRPWRIHDIRRTVSTGMSSIRIQPHVVEACLNHVSGFKGGVAGVYNVHEYEDEKREALAAWASHLDRLVGGGAASNVVSIRRAEQ